MKIEKFHIYLADLNPQFGTEPGKIRPVVVVQTNLLNAVHPSTIICPVTTNVHQDAQLLRVHLTIKDNGLTASSDVLVDQIRSIDNKRLLKHIGVLTLNQKQQLLDNLKVIILE